MERVSRPLRVLFVSPYVPSPLRVRPFNLVRHLSRNGHHVTVLALRSGKRDETDARNLRRDCERVETVRLHAARSLWSCTRGIPTRVPFQAWYCYTPALRRLVRLELGSAGAGEAGGRSSPGYDLLHVEHMRAALFGLDIEGIPRIYDAVDCISGLLDQTLVKGTGKISRLLARLDRDRTRRFESLLVRQFDRTLVSSAGESRELAAVCGFGASTADGYPAPYAGSKEAISVLPNGVDLEYFKRPEGPRDPATVVYVGRMGYHANVAAARHLIEAVMPRVWARRADARVAIVGADPPESLRRLVHRRSDRVSLTGYVADVRPYLARATVSASPLLYAAGIQNKVLEAMAMEAPVVATPAACAAISARDGEDLLLGSGPEQLAQHILRLIEDHPLRDRLAQAARRYVESHHDWGAVARRLETFYRETLGRFSAAAATAEVSGRA